MIGLAIHIEMKSVEWMYSVTIMTTFDTIHSRTISLILFIYVVPSIL